MVHRPVYLPASGSIGVVVKDIEFTWFAGFSVSQKQKSIASLHESCARAGLSNILEISTKSMQEDGVAASAFNLSFYTKRTKKKITVEAAFQGSKIFEHTGPHPELYVEPSHVAKKAIRTLAEGRLIGFELFGKPFPTTPLTFFYDWLYMNALNMDESLAVGIQAYDGFTDIEFNPQKSINCQAFSAALFVSICRNGKRDHIGGPVGEYEELLIPFYESVGKGTRKMDRLI